jgi:prepilin-type N-terminal cleavage/methylation domain-containing protein
MLLRLTRGYTLIELIVSIAIFSVVMLLATSAYLALISYTHQARATSTLMTNLSYAVDQMSREIRTGTNYACGSGGDCVGGTSFSFTNDQGHAVTYILADGALARCVDQSSCSAANASPLTDAAVTISNLQFYAKGTGTYGAGDKQQPYVVMAVKGSVSAGDRTISFSIETSATQRLIDL